MGCATVPRVKQNASQGAAFSQGFWHNHVRHFWGFLAAQGLRQCWKLGKQCQDADGSLEAAGSRRLGMAVAYKARVASRNMHQYIAAQESRHMPFHITDCCKRDACH